jgi:hypothetical protein
LDYLSAKLKGRFRSCDPALHDALNGLVAENQRSVIGVQQQVSLSPDTSFFAEPLSFSGLPKGTSTAIAQRVTHRQNWLKRALAAIENSDIIFVDPDNGLEVKSVAVHQDKSAKFCFYDEVMAIWAREQSLVIYQHCNRSGNVQTQIKRRKNELYERLHGPIFVESLYFPCYSGRIFFIVCAEKQQSLLSRRIGAFKEKFKMHISG